MSWEEKYGGIWNLRLRKGDAVLSEQYWPDIEAVTVVVLRSDGLLSAFVLRKGNDPQWQVPFWQAPDGPALVETEDDANRYFRAVFGKEA